MKKLNLLLIPLLFSSLLAGCGMKGPLYRTTETAPITKQVTTPDKELTEQGNTAVAEK